MPIVHRVESESENDEQISHALYTSSLELMLTASMRTPCSHSATMVSRLRYRLCLKHHLARSQLLDRRVQRIGAIFETVTNRNISRGYILVQISIA